MGLSVLSDKGRASLARGEVVHESLMSETGKSADSESLLPSEPESDPELDLTEVSGLVVGSGLDNVVVGLVLTDDEELSSIFPGLTTLDLGVWSGTTATVVEVGLGRQELRRAWCIVRLW